MPTIVEKLRQIRVELDEIWAEDLGGMSQPKPGCEFVGYAINELDSALERIPNGPGESV